MENKEKRIRNEEEEEKSLIDYLLNISIFYVIAFVLITSIGLYFKSKYLMLIVISCYVDYIISLVATKFYFSHQSKKMRRS